MRGLLLIPLLLLVSAAPKEDNATSALINAALDKTVNLRLDGVLPEVLKKIEADTGVRIEPEQSVYLLLPWGEETSVKAQIENQTLRNALSAITRKLGLTWDLGQFEVWIKPMPALARLGRRATVAELQALDLLSATPMGLKSDHLTVQELVDAVDQKLATIKGPALAVEFRSGDQANPQAGFVKLDKPINTPRNATMAEAMEELARQTDATWYPWGKNIVIVPKQQQIRLQLDKQVTAHFNGTDISEVLDWLSDRSGVPFQIEPGAIQRVPPEYRSVKLDMENATIRRVLDDIRGVTGLDYVVKADGVYIWNQNPNPSAYPHANDPSVAILTLDGGVQLLLRESQVPGDVREYLARKTQEEITRLRRRMKDEGFVPATQPATQAAGEQ